MTMFCALWMWKRRSTRKRLRRTRKSHLSYYKYKLRGKVLRPEVPWSEVGAQGLIEPCELDVEEVVLHVPIARHESQHKKLKVVLWLAMMYSAQATEGSPVAESHCERVSAEGLQLKQLIRFCLRLEESKFQNDEEVEMKLYLDSTSAQAMISHLGPGRSKHISTHDCCGHKKH